MCRLSGALASLQKGYMMYLFSSASRIVSVGSRRALYCVAFGAIAGVAGMLPNMAQAQNACINTPSQVVTDPSGDQGALNPTQADIQSISVGEDYRYIGTPRLVFNLKVADLSTVPANQVWRVRWTFGTTTYYVAMTSDNGNNGQPPANVNFEYGTQSGSTVTTVGGLEAGSFTPDGTITMTIAMSKVGNPTAGSSLTAINGVTQKNVGGTLFTGEDSTSSGTYTVRAQGTTCTPVPLPQPGAATYLKGGMTFSPNYTTKAPYIGQDVEPSVRCDKFGNCYVAPIRGVPGGTDLWYFDLRPTVNGSPNPNYDPFMRNPIYRGQPDKIADIPGDGTVGGDGGGDVDMAVGFNSEATENPSAPPTLAYSSLVLANISTQRSTDRGVTFVKNPSGNVTGGVPGDDRQWMEFFGSQYVYLIYRTLAPAVAQVQRSVDGGLTYGETTVVGTIGQVGGVDVDQNDGTVYLSGSNGVVAVGIPPVPGPPSPTTSLPPATYTIHNVAGTGNAHLFFTVKVASDGTVYACYSDDHNVFIKFSQDKGTTWSSAIRVSDGPETLTSVFPWMETGPTPGTIGVVWYGSDKASTGDNSADWHVFYAQGTNVTSNPVFRQAEASDHVIHGANISEAGLVVGGMSPNRNLADYFQIAFDPTGAAVIGYADDHNDISGHAYVARQISGPGVNGGAAIPTPVEGSSLPPQLFEPKPTAASVGGIPGSQVTDQRDDVRTGGNPQTGGTIVIPNDDPADILSVKYSTEGTAAQPVLVCTMKVSDLTAIPPSTNWRMHFTANAPNSVLSPTGEYTFGVSDRGDQFFVRASTDAAGAQTFMYGTATRNFDGTITYTDQGSADSGAFDQANTTITLKVAVSKLNAALATGRPPLGPGSILAGLRATTFTTAAGSGNNRADTARGGTQFEISFPVALTSVVSRKTHTGVGDFDVNLPLTGTRGIECRTGGATGDFKLVFTFPNNLTSVASASVTSHDPASGTGTVSSSMIGPNLNQYTVNLTNVSNIQYITVTLNSVVDAASNSGNVVGPSTGILLGDTTADASVNSADVSQTKSQSGQFVTGSNFREDVTVDGSINSADISLVKSKSGTALP